MDLLMGLSHIQKGHDVIWVADIWTKSVHFLPMKSLFSIDRLAKLYMEKIVR